MVAVGGSIVVMVTTGCLRGVLLLWAVDKEACLYCGRYFGWCFVSCGWLNWCDGDSGLLEGRVIYYTYYCGQWMKRHVYIVGGTLGGVLLLVGGSIGVMATVGCLRGVLLLWAVDKEACLYCGRYFGWCFVSCGWLERCGDDSGLLEGRDITVGSG